METLLLDDAVAHTRTGDIWLFRGRSVADRAIRVATNAPVNHVGMAVVLEDLPPLMWHAELGRSLEDVWTGRRQRGVQLHMLHEAVRNWHDRYRQRAYLRQLEAVITPEMEDAVLRTIAQLDGTPFPSVPNLATRWLRGRAHNRASLETLFCAEVVATTYLRMGLIAEERPENWYDPGRFWSGDRLELTGGADLRPEISVTVPALPGDVDAASEEGSALRRAAALSWWRENAERIRADRLADPLRSAASAAMRAAETTARETDAWRSADLRRVAENARRATDLARGAQPPAQAVPPEDPTRDA